MGSREEKMVNVPCPHLSGAEVLSLRIAKNKKKGDFYCKPQELWRSFLRFNFMTKLDLIKQVTSPSCYLTLRQTAPLQQCSYICKPVSSTLRLSLSSCIVRLRVSAAPITPHQSAFCTRWIAETRALCCTNSGHTQSVSCLRCEKCLSVDTRPSSSIINKIGALELCSWRKPVLISKEFRFLSLLCDYPWQM